MASPVHRFKALSVARMKHVADIREGIVLLCGGETEAGQNYEQAHGLEVEVADVMQVGEAGDVGPIGTQSHGL